MDPEEELPQGDAPNPEIADYTNDQQYQEQPQSSGLGNAQTAADLAVGGLLYKNAPKGSFLRKIQAGVRLARQKGFQAIRHPIQTIKDMGPEAKATRQAAKENRYQNLIKDKKLTSPEQVENYIKTNGGDAEGSLSRLHKEVGGNRDYFKPENFAEKPPVVSPEVAPPPVLEPGITPPPIITSPVTAPPVLGGAAAEAGVGEGAAEAAAGQGLRGVETKAIGAAGKKIALEGGKIAAKQGLATAAGTAAGEGAVVAGEAAVAGGAAATAGGAAAVGGTIAAEAAIPVAGWVAAAATAVVAGTVALFKSKKTKERLGLVLLAMAVVVLIPAVIFILVAMKFISPVNLAITTAQKFQADTLAATFGNTVALRRTILSDAETLISTLQKAETLADTKYSGEQASNAKGATMKVIADLEIIKNQTDNATRAALAKKISTSITDLRNTYPEMMGFSKNCSELDRYINGDKEGQLVVLTTQDRIRITSGKVLRVKGGGSSGPTQEINASPYVCQTLNFLLSRGYKIQVGLTFGHTQKVKNKKVDSTHYHGGGIDISVISGEVVSPSSSSAQTVMNLLNDNSNTLKITSILGPNYRSKGEKGGKYSTETYPGHSDHIHISTEYSKQ